MSLNSMFWVRNARYSEASAEGTFRPLIWFETLGVARTELPASPHVFAFRPCRVLRQSLGRFLRPMADNFNRC
jgi:hypothetical protein